MDFRSLIEKLKNRGIYTVAFVHNQVNLHTVLPVIACDELVMKKADAEGRGGVLGDVQGGRQGEMEPAVKQAYDSEARRLGPKGVLLLKMTNRNLQLVRTKKNGALWYVKKGEVPAAEEETPPELKQVLESETTSFDAKTAEGLYLCNKFLRTREEVARAYRVRLEPLLGQEKIKTALVEFRGPVNKAEMESLMRSLQNAAKEGNNQLIIQMEERDPVHGDLESVGTFARRLSELEFNGLPLKTIAFIQPKKTLAAGTFLALGCTEIALGEGAVLGDFSHLPKDQLEKFEGARKMLVKLATERGYPELLFRAMLDPNVVVYRARKKDGKYELVTKQMLTDKPDQWSEPALLGSQLKLDNQLAKDLEDADLRVVQHNKVKDLDDLYSRYGINRSEVRRYGDWLSAVAEFFRQPLVNVLLIMIGIAGLILELKMPGVGIPGVISAICFVLFFWAYSFVGEFTMLAVMLFVLGLILIGVEVFILPGVMAFGIGGVLLVIVSLVLVTLTKMPQSTSDWLSLGATLTTFGVGLVAAIAAAFVLAWYLPHIPYASRLMLKPPTESDEPARTDSFATVDYKALLGAIGVAATTLRPAGKARIGDEYLDVVAEGDYVNPGSRVQVIEIEGNRIVVKEV
jgi:membrane-bound ClpP family serine protease